jgi:hypothetical protein
MFSKAASLFQILISYFSLAYPLFSFLRLSIFISNFCVVSLFTDSLSLILQSPDSGQYHRQLLWRIGPQVYLMSSHVCQDMMNLMCVFSIKRVYENLCMLRCGNTVGIFFTITFRNVAEFTTPITLSLLISYKLSFPFVGFRMRYLPSFAQKSSVFRCCLGIVSSTRRSSP